VLKTGPGGLTSPATPQVPPISLGNVPTDVSVNHAGDVLYVGSRNGGINGFRWDGSTHSPLPGSPFFVGTTHLSGLASDFYEKVLVAFGANVSRASSATVSLDSSLAATTGSPLTPGIVPTGGALSPDGRLLFLSNGSAQLDAYAVDESGALLHLPAYPTSLGVTAGHSKLVTFPNKGPTPAPALPIAATALLAAGFLRLGWRRR
jgi:hypothetical protein